MNKDNSSNISKVSNAKKDDRFQANSDQKKLSQELDAEQSLDPSKIGEYIQLLQEYEKNCLKENNFKEAELVTKRIGELQQHELVYRSLAVVEKNKEEISELEQLHLQQFNEFNEIWDQIIDEHVQKLKQIEDNLVNQHQQELTIKEDELKAIQPGKCKHSREVLNQRVVLQNLIKCKKYGEAHEVKENIARMEQLEEEKWLQQHEVKLQKKRELIIQKNKQEIDALQVRLENSLQEKIKIRTVELEKQGEQLNYLILEYERLLQKFQNMKNELEVRQNSELSKLQIMNNKAMSKLSTKTSGLGNSQISAIGSSKTFL